jgi:hypothetical protein
LHSIGGRCQLYQFVVGNPGEPPPPKDPPRRADPVLSSARAAKKFGRPDRREVPNAIGCKPREDDRCDEFIAGLVDIAEVAARIVRSCLGITATRRQ